MIRVILVLLLISSSSFAKDRAAVYLGGGQFQGDHTDNGSRSVQSMYVDFTPEKRFAYDLGIYYGAGGMFSATFAYDAKSGPFYAGLMGGINEQYVVTSDSNGAPTLNLNFIVGPQAGLDFEIWEAHLRFNVMLTNHIQAETISLGVSL